MIYTRFMLKPLICAVLLVCPFLQVQAQLVSPWFRGSSAAWQALLKNTAFPPLSAKLAQPLSSAATGFAVKTTASNWVLHRISHSGAFCRMEKEILTAPFKSEKTLLGKLAYFHDRDARLFALLPANKSADDKAFWRHQDLLENTLAEVESHFAPVLPERFASAMFPQEEVKRLLDDPVQPPAYALYAKEMEAFAALPTLEAQRAWARSALEYTWKSLHSLLIKNPSDIKPVEFEQYYRQKLRLEYFKTLNEVLAKSTAKRNTLIIRRKRKLNANLPGAGQPMTDAQRLGLLQFTLDKMEDSAQTLFPEEDLPARYLETKALLQQMSKVYEPYAAAEALGAPYEWTIRHGSAWPDLLGQEKAAYLRALKGQAIFTDLPPLVARLDEQMAALRRQTPADADFYARYYRLWAEKNVYNTILARERFFRAFNPK